MDFLNQRGIVILHGDLNAIMGTVFVDISEDLVTNPFGEIWIRNIKHTKWRPLPNTDKKMNKITYRNIGAGHASVLDHTIMNFRDLDLVYDTDNWEVRNIMKADHSALSVHLKCPMNIKEKAQMMKQRKNVCDRMETAMELSKNKENNENKKQNKNNNDDSN